jgi:hypothetical protein
MNKNIIWAVIIVLIVVVLGFVSLRGDDSITTEDKQNMEQDDTNTVPTKSSGTLGEIFTQGGNYTCEVNRDGDGNITEGVIYQAGEKTRFDLRVELANGDATETHVIRDGTSMYTWLSGQTAGVKTQITDTTPLIIQPQGGGSVIGENESFNWNCRAWLTDESVLTLPSDITFIEA